MTALDLQRIQKEALLSDVALARLLTNRPTERATRKRFLDAATKLGIAVPPNFFVQEA